MSGGLPGASPNGARAPSRSRASAVRQWQEAHLTAVVDPADLRWNELAADIVFDSSGRFLIEQQEVQS